MSTDKRLMVSASAVPVLHTYLSSHLSHGSHLHSPCTFILVHTLIATSGSPHRSLIISEAFCLLRSNTGFGSRSLSLLRGFALELPASPCIPDPTKYVAFYLWAIAAFAIVEYDKWPWSVSNWTENDWYIGAHYCYRRLLSLLGHFNSLCRVVPGGIVPFDLMTPPLSELVYLYMYSVSNRNSTFPICTVRSSNSRGVSP